MDTKIIGGKIANARKKMNISQAQLAERLFISPQAVGKWERGESVPDIITINRLAELLGVDLNYFSNSSSVLDEGMTIQTNAGMAGDNQAAQEANPSSRPERELLTDFSGSNLAQSDFAGVTAHNRKFNGSALRGSDFAGADLAGSSFKASDVREANFDGANLAGCTFSASDLTDASFSKSMLVRTEFKASGLTRAKFTDAQLTNAKLTATDLRKTIFENCVFSGVDFSHSDLRGVSLDKQTFIDVTFDSTALNEATFNGSTLKNVSLRSTFTLTGKYYRAIKTINFDGATMDKLTFAALKGMGAGLSQVTVV